MPMSVVNYSIDSSTLKLLCGILKKRYDDIPWFSIRVIIDLPSVEGRYIPEKVKELLERYGLDWPSDYEEEQESTGRRHEADNLNEEKVSILNEAVSLGCQWAIEEMERLSGILPQPEE